MGVVGAESSTKQLVKRLAITDRSVGSAPGERAGSRRGVRDGVIVRWIQNAIHDLGPQTLGARLVVTERTVAGIQTMAPRTDVDAQRASRHLDDEASRMKQRKLPSLE